MNRTLRALFCFTLLVAPAIALAHSPFKGIGNFYGGLLHPVFVPAHALLLSALGLLLGQQEPEENLFPLLAFLTCALAGLVIAGNASGGEFETLQLLGAAAIGLLVAINPRIPVLLRALGGAFAGLLIGLDSDQADLAGAPLLASLIGTGLGMSVFLLCIMSFASYFKARQWQQIGIRVIGSWITASAVLVLSLSLVGGTGLGQ
jgi:hydrogenase/urease accessory protein HupE